MKSKLKPGGGEGAMVNNGVTSAVTSDQVKVDVS